MFFKILSCDLILRPITSQACKNFDYLPFFQLIDKLGSALYSKNEEQLKKEKESLEIILKHQISLIAMSLDEFVSLKTSTRVSNDSFHFINL